MNISNLTNTMHFTNERAVRNNNIINIIGGYGVARYSFVVDTNHPNGNEIHTITTNGIVVMQNERTKALITAIVARPNQIARYFEYGIPNNVYPIIAKARTHQTLNYNNW